MRRLLVISQDRVGDAMGGNAIRAVELARSFAARARVTLAAPGAITDPAFDHAPFDPMDPRPLRPRLREADAVLSTPQSPLVAGELRRCGARLIYDLYDPGPLEVLQIFASASRLRRTAAWTLSLDASLNALRDGHHFLCASERQRDLWLGAMLACRLITPAVHRRTPSLRDVIDVVPFGVPAAPPRAVAGTGPRARFPAIAPGDEVVLWNGGIWNWMDPVTAVSAMATLSESRPRARLVFMGRAPTEPEAARASASARELASRLGLLERCVFFNDAWVGYDERASWLLEAACAVSAHHDDLEARFSFRTRLLDCVWAGLPVVCTGGDELSARIAREDLGEVVEPGDVVAMAAAVERVLDRGRGHYRERLARAAEDHRWDRVAEPLGRYVDGPDVPRLGTGLSHRAARPAQQARALGTRLMRRAAIAGR